MKCKCGGDLKRIAVNCYQCEVCGLKQAVTFASLPMETSIMPNIIDLNISSNIEVDLDFKKKLEENIYNALGVSSEYLNNSKK